MIKVTIDLTPNRHFCNLKLEFITLQLSRIGFTKQDRGNKYNIYKHTNKGTISVEDNGQISIECEITNISSEELNNMIIRCRELLKELNPYYNYLLSDDTFFIYWPLNFTEIKNSQLDIPEYKIKTYEIMDGLYSTIVQKSEI